jgi:hypothetical protein
MRSSPNRNRLEVESKRKAGASHRARLLPLVLPLLALAFSSRADQPSVAVGNSGSGCRVAGSFRAAVPETLAWQVLTDYDHISRFVSSMRQSRIERRTDDSLFVRQDAISSFFIFHRHVQVLLDVRETPASRIAFYDVLGKDFREYRGEWRISSDSTDTVVNYELLAEPHVPMPRSMCRGMLRDVARDLLSQVRAEMLRRATLPNEVQR